MNLDTKNISKNAICLLFCLPPYSGGCHIVCFFVCVSVSPALSAYPRILLTLRQQLYIDVDAALKMVKQANNTCIQWSLYNKNTKYFMKWPLQNQATKGILVKASSLKLEVT